MIGLREEFSLQKQQNKQILILTQSFNKTIYGHNILFFEKSM